jgi:hypothetical protein
MSALAGALGSVIGYLGSEVAERALFERLLWPRRFYNDFNFSIFLKLMFLMPMGGPLHAAALKTLDNFREHGLYLGRCRGNMLGTAFFPDSQVKNYLRTQEEERGLAKASRNALWLEVLRNVNETDEKPHLPQNDAESKNGEIPPYRAMQLVRHLTLGLVPDTQSIESGIVSIKEDSVTWRALVGIFSSELSTMAAAFTAGKPLKCWWLIPYFCTPLFLKLLAVLVSVRRAPLQSVDELEKQSSLSPTEIFEIDDLNHGFAVIEGPAPVVQQFFRHYSHPIRHSQSIGLGDRSRELFSIALIYAFVLYFPVGLVCLLWMRLKVQYLWLGYQVYAIIVMHVIRILGWGGCGRTEERIAGHLKRGKTVWLQTQTGCTVSAKLAVTSVPNVATGRKAVQAIIERHHQQRNNDSDSSGSPCSSQVASASGDSRKRSEQQLVPHFVGNRPVELGANFTSPSNERDVRPAPGSPNSGPTVTPV